MLNDLLQVSHKNSLGNRSFLFLELSIFTSSKMAYSRSSIAIDDSFYFYDEIDD